MFISEAWAQTAETAASGGSVSGVLIQLGLIFVIFYFLLIRPQQKKIKQHEAMLSAIKKGDKILTGGGVYAKVLKAEDPLNLTVELAPNMVVEINRATVRDVITPEVEAAAAELRKNEQKKQSKKK
jgi:preprotein translocase, yajC subunit